MTPKAPPFDVPPGAIAQVHIIDTTVRMVGMPVNFVLTPSLDGFETLGPLAAWSFLVQSSKGEKVLFDLSIPPNAASCPPIIREMFKKASVKIEGAKNVADILKENKIDPADIGSVIWSHHHFDHIGDITTFPKTTEIVVGPGFKDAFLPGCTAQPDEWLEESNFEGRTLREIDFSEPKLLQTVGAFRAYDFFGDGSFYLLDTPGHDIGHLAGLARTTSNPDTFIFMGGDLCHHGGEIRPSPHLPIPVNVPFSPIDSIRARSFLCLGGSQFQALNIMRGRKADEPFFDSVITVDFAEAVQTIKDSQLADAQSNVFFVFAHEMAIEGVVDFFPLSANDWKKKGWRAKTLWSFLTDLAPAIK